MKHCSTGLCRGAVTAIGLVTAVVASAPASIARASAATVAVAPFAYLDTSGEPVDQASRHKA